MKQIIETLSLPLLKRITKKVGKNKAVDTTHEDKQVYVDILVERMNTSFGTILSELVAYVLEHYEFNSQLLGKKEAIEWNQKTTHHTFLISYKVAPSERWSTAEFSFAYEEDGTNQPTVSSHQLGDIPKEDHLLIEWYLFSHLQLSSLYMLLHSAKEKSLILSFLNAYHSTSSPFFRYLRSHRAFSDRYEIHVELPGISGIHLCIVVDAEQSTCVNAMLIIENKEIFGFHEVFDANYLTHYVFEESPCRLHFLFQ